MSSIVTVNLDYEELEFFIKCPHFNITDPHPPHIHTHFSTLALYLPPLCCKILTSKGNLLYETITTTHTAQEGNTISTPKPTLQQLLRLIVSPSLSETRILLKSNPATFTALKQRRPTHNDHTQ